MQEAFRETGDRDYFLKRRSNAARASSGVAVVARVPVRSNDFAGENRGHVLRSFFAGIRTGIGWVHSNFADVSKNVHWAQEWRSAPQRGQVESTRMSSRSRCFSPHDLHAKTTALSVSIPRPRGAPSDRPSASGRGPRGRLSSEEESWYPRCRYFRSFKGKPKSSYLTFMRNG